MIAGKLVGVTPGRFWNAAQQARAMAGYQRVLYRWALEPIGGGYSDAGPVGREGIRAVQEAASAAYDRALGDAEVRLPTGYAAFSPAWAKTADSGRAAAAIQALGLGEDFRALPTNAQEEVSRTLSAKLAHPLRSVEHRGRVPARALKEVQSAIRARAVQLAHSSDIYLRDAGALLSHVGERLTGTIAANNPEIAQQLKQADDTWRRLVLLESAVPSAVAKKGVDEAILSPRQILNAMHGSDTSPRQRQFLAGTVPFQKIFETHRSVLGEPPDDSMLSLEMGTGMLEGLGFAAHGFPGMGALLLGSTLPFTKQGAAAARALAFSPSVAPAIRGAVTPLAAALGHTIGGSGQ
ncbi:MAG: hypothetical protein M0002_16165 [Rhodospirillales bacterium]|nr:hypothetical protein [Rhodospirillales bacterium]